MSSLKDLKKLKEACDNAYYNTGEEILLDSEYDALVEKINSKSNKKIETVGAAPRQNAVKLPVWMGSLDKVKTQDEIDRWCAKETSDTLYCLSPKLDGISCLLVIKNKEVNLYTRGNGKTGSDISVLAKSINGVETVVYKFLKYHYSAIRGELVMKKEVFQKKYSSQFSNPRNLVSGMVNSLQIEGMKDVDFVPYEIIEPKISECTPSKVFKIFGISSILIKKVDYLDVFELGEILSKLKVEYPYEVDGIVIQPDREYIRNKDKNPSYMKAFKGETETVETKVEYVEWNVSKRGCLKPRVKVETVHVGGVDISFATGFNAKFIVENKVGPGSIIKITRSGDVIPFIKEVVKPSKVIMPDQPYKWDENKVDIYLEDINPIENTIAFVHKMPEEQAIRLIESFFKSLDIKNMGIGTVTKLYKAGFRTIKHIYEGKPEDFMKLENFQSKSASRLYESLHSQKPPISTLLGAFGIPNLGKRKAELILEHIPNLMNFKSSKDLDSVKPLKGVPRETLEEIVKYMPSFNQFTKAIDFEVKESNDKSKQPLLGNKVVKEIKDYGTFPSGSNFVFTGFRDKELERKLKNMGYDVKSAVSGRTTAVIRDTEDWTTKVQAAEKLGIPVYTKQEFLHKL